MSESIEMMMAELGSFDPEERSAAIERLAELEGSEQIEPEPSGGAVNMHCHTFFSYNAWGYSPARIAWEAHMRGLEVAGVVDFDCLDAVGEFLKAGRTLALKTTAGFETRVYIDEYRDRVINSPKEPGVFYLVGAGFTEVPPPGSPAAAVLKGMASGARERNLDMLRRLNSHLDPVRLDYERDVLPLTVAGNATERHVLDAYEARARAAMPEPEALAGFWAERLDVDAGKVGSLLDRPVMLKELVRARLMKHGGVGYAEPGEGAFPPIEEVVGMTLECGAMPSGCWLDGTNDGEADPVELFSFLREKGCVSITMVPDRNWNVAEDERALRVANLARAVEAARGLQMPILVGTEMNKPGNKFVDEFDSEALSPHFEEFRRGAHIAWGHTLLKMTAGIGYVGSWAEEQFGSDAAGKNEFFRRIGAAPYPGGDVLARCAQMGTQASPEALTELLCDGAGCGAG